MPILVEGSGLPVLVVGGGPVAVRKAAAFARAGASVRVIARAASPQMRALAEASSVALDEREYASSDVGDAVLVVAATADRTVNARVADDARAAGRLVNVADAPATGSFATMATHHAGHLAIGVSAGGVPGAAARIRDAIANRFDDRYARALERIATLRRTLLDRGDGDVWRAVADAALDDAFCDAVEQGTIDARVSAWR
ncbi:MAG TPA: NAD(P)-dependent oxidoreductase [Gemmatimonadaceae bacterium]|nr:NAD(P)-dependent oxidoreductase [Gemmatimonadaceae bacterium]